MRRELANLIEAVRNLGLSRVPSGCGITINGNREEVSAKFERLLASLEAYDRATSSANASEASASQPAQEKPAPQGHDDPTMNPLLLRQALNGMFNWLKDSGHDISRAHDIVADALTAEPAPSEGRKPRPKPSFIAGGKGGKFKIVTDLIPPPDEKVSLKSLADREFRASQADRIMAHAAPSRT